MISLQDEAWECGTEGVNWLIFYLPIVANAQMSKLP